MRIFPRKFIRTVKVDDQMMSPEIREQHKPISVEVGFSGVSVSIGNDDRKIKASLEFWAIELSSRSLQEDPGCAVRFLGIMDRVKSMAVEEKTSYVEWRAIQKSLWWVNWQLGVQGITKGKVSPSNPGRQFGDYVIPPRKLVRQKAALFRGGYYMGC